MIRAEDTVEAFYKGRQINLIVGYGPGGGGCFDEYGRGRYYCDS